jgi:hypothetical protein
VNWLKKDLRTIVVAVVAATVTAGAPALAHGVQHALFAHNADKVDGKHAVGSGASTTQAAGKVVAAGANGRFAPKFMPNGFAGPRAFATVNYETVDFEEGQQRRGFSAVSRPFTGIYCLTVTPSSGIDAETATVLVSVHHGLSGGTDLFAYWNEGEGSTCSGNQIEVVTYEHGTPSLAVNTISFSVAVM